MIVAIVGIVGGVALLLQAAPPPTVGMPQRIEGLVLPGSELIAKPLEDRRSPIVLRITASYRHGTDTRYDLVYFGLEPGDHDLKDYLLRKDGSSTDGLPAIPVTVIPAYPLIEKRTVVDPEGRGLPLIGGYTIAAIGLGIVWAIGLLAIIFVGRKKTRGDETDPSKPLTLADKLRPLVEKASRGSMSVDEKARLERVLIAFWRKRASLEGLNAFDALLELKKHVEAGPLIQKLELWLHRPGGDPDDRIVEGLDELLKPYKNVSPDELEEPGRGS